MRVVHERQHSGTSEEFDKTGIGMKKILYWIIVFLALICVICIGIIVIHWSINWRMA